MPGRIRLFITATQDLEEEREVIAHVVAQLPTSIGWEIGRVAPSEDPLQTAVQAIRRSSVYLFLLGRDINAPAGVKWDIAQRASKNAFGYRKEVLRTQAAEAFARTSGIRWSPFETDRQLGQLVRSDLITHLRQEVLRYGLSAADYEALTTAESAPLTLQSEELVRPDGLGAVSGTAAGGVVLGPADPPRGGVLVGVEDRKCPREDDNEDLEEGSSALSRPDDS